MSWTAYHSRSDVLRPVAEQVERRRDGVLPTAVPDGVFHDTLDLVGALHFRWHHRLTGCLERQLADRPEDLSGAVRDSWADAARSLPGLRALLDAQLAEPADDATAQAMARATAKERMLLAAMAGRAGRLDQRVDERAVRVGRELEEAARETLARHPAAPATQSPTREPRGSASFVRRLRAALAA